MTGNERQRWHDKRGHGQQCNNLLVNMAALGGREAGPGQSNGEHGHIERKCGGDMTRGDMLAEAEAVDGRVGGRVSSRQLSGSR